MENIFIVTRGENYEGGFVDSVWSKPEDAEARKVEIEQEMSSCEWVYVRGHEVR